MSLKKNHDKLVDTQFWDDRRGVFRTKKGGWVIGEAVYCHGYDMMNELVGKKSFFQVLILNVTGKMVERNVADWLEASFVCLSWPDPKIWCNQIGSLGGTMRSSPPAAVSMGILAADSVLYGSLPLVAAGEFIINAEKKRREGASVSDIIENEKRHTRALPTVPGYIRPIASGDERVIALEALATELKLSDGMHLDLARKIHHHLLKNHKGMSMNMAGYCSAFLVDQGFTPTQIYQLFSACVNSGVHACYVEAYDNPPDAFLPLKCEDIEYKGKRARKLL